MCRYSICKVSVLDNNIAKNIANVFSSIDIEFSTIDNSNNETNYLAEWLVPNKNRINHFWIAKNRYNQIIGVAILKYKNTIIDPNSARVDIRVLKKYRKKGLGKELLIELCNFASLINRNKFTSRTNKQSHSHYFLRKIGALQKDITIGKTLDLKNVNPKMLNLTIGNDYRLVKWENEAKGTNLTDLVKAKHFLNDMPSGSRESVSWVFSENWVIQEEKTRKVATELWYTYLLYHKNMVIGYSDVDFYEGNKTAYQIDTAIHPDYRNKGFGKFLKARIINDIINENKGIKYIRTFNSSSNHSMNRINSEFGFIESIFYSKWIVNLDIVIEKLNKYEKI